jgi:hypothetical protein
VRTGNLPGISGGEGINLKEPLEWAKYEIPVVQVNQNLPYLCPAVPQPEDRSVPVMVYTWYVMTIRSLIKRSKIIKNRYKKIGC